MSGGLEVLSLKEEDMLKFLAAGVHLGSTNVDFQMLQYVFKRKPDGIYIVNLKKTWEKLLLAARALAAIENPADICVISARPYGQRAVLKFAVSTGSTPIAGRFTPGTFTNQIQAAFREPRLLVVTDPRIDHQPVTEASYVNIPVIAFCNTDSPLLHVDIAIPCNNKIMFPDSEVARKMTLGRTKVGYLIRHGLGPHFAQLLKERVKKESCFTLLFDESLNDSLQKKQLDVHIRIWENNQVCTLYLSSIFMGHASACDLLGQLLPICQEYGAHKLVQISMDGPNVNWKLHRDLQLVLAKETGKQLLNVGSCGLHIIHNSFRAGHGASKWEVDDFLSSLHYLFNESPARREDFSAITGSHVFPLPFCKHRWLENVKVAQRALAMWPFVVQYVKSVREDKAKLPQNKSFKVIEECVKDALLLPKLHSYVSVAEIVLPFLTRYQDDKPMLPFLADDLSSVVKDLLQRVAKPSVMEGLSSSYQVANLNLDDKVIFKNIMKMDLGYVAERAIKESKMGELSVRELKTQFKDFVVTMLKKILLKSPISYSLCRALDCLDPGKLEHEKTLGHFSTVLQKLEEAGHISAADVDKTKAQYQKARETLRRQQMPFSRTHDRLDNYWHNGIGHDPELQDLWRVVRLLLTMSHGQAAVERGFSVNKEIMTENKSEDTLIAQRLIYSHISRVGGIENVQMNQSIMSAARSAKAKYMEHLEEEKKRKESEQTSRKRKEREGELNTLRENVKRLKTIHVALVDDADSYALKAEAKSDFALLAKSNAFRSAAANKKEELEKAEKELRDKELEFSSNP